MKAIFVILLFLISCGPVQRQTDDLSSASVADFLQRQQQLVQQNIMTAEYSPYGTCTASIGACVAKPNSETKSWSEDTSQAD